LTEEAALGLWDAIKAGFLDKDALSIVTRVSAPHTFMNWQVVLHCSPDARPYDLEKLKIDLNTHIKAAGIVVPGLQTQPYFIVEDSPDSKARKAAVARAAEVLEEVGKFRPHREWRAGELWDPRSQRILGRYLWKSEKWEWCADNLATLGISVESLLAQDAMLS
jgi:hypothetical protein